MADDPSPELAALSLAPPEDDVQLFEASASPPQGGGEMEEKADDTPEKDAGATEGGTGLVLEGSEEATAAAAGIFATELTLLKGPPVHADPQASNNNKSDDNNNNNNTDDNNSEIGGKTASGGDNENERKLTPEECEAMTAKVLEYARGGTGMETQVGLGALRDLMLYSGQTLVSDVIPIHDRLAQLATEHLVKSTSTEDSVLATQCVRGLLSQEREPPIQQILDAGAVPVLLLHTKSDNELLTFGSLSFPIFFWLLVVSSFDQSFFLTSLWDFQNLCGPSQTSRRV
jgi:hypothetical protein